MGPPGTRPEELIGIDLNCFSDGFLDFVPPAPKKKVKIEKW